MDFSKISNEELIQIVNNELNQWQGTDNGDTISQYQGRQCYVYAAALILIGREMTSNEAILSRDQAVDLFFSKMRLMIDQNQISGVSGYDRFNIETLLNLWKVRFQSRNQGEL